MASVPSVEVGQTFIATSDTRSPWRVDKLLSDGIHVSLVRLDEPSRRKTISIWALNNAAHFRAADDAR